MKPIYIIERDGKITITGIKSVNQPIVIKKPKGSKLEIRNCCVDFKYNFFQRLWNWLFGELDLAGIIVKDEAPESQNNGLSQHNP
jgi:hypothetical protein